MSPAAELEQNQNSVALRTPALADFTVAHWPYGERAVRTVFTPPKSAFSASRSLARRAAPDTLGSQRSNKLISATTGPGWRTAKAARHLRSEVDLFSDAQGVFEFDAQIADGAVDLGVAEQQLHRPQVASLAVNFGSLGAT